MHSTATVCIETDQLRVTRFWVRIFMLITCEGHNFRFRILQQLADNLNQNKHCTTISNCQSTNVKGLSLHFVCNWW